MSPRSRREGDCPIEWRLIEAPATLELPLVGPFAHNVCTIPDIMAGKLSSHVSELLHYLKAPPHEAANQHRAHAYFQHVFGDTFQVDEGQSDGYVAGRFVVELKGASSDWHAGLIQGLAYHKRLDFSAVVVAAHEFLAVWRLDDLPRALIEKVEATEGSPHEVGQKLAAWYRKNAKDLIQAHLKVALWRCPAEIFTPLLPASPAQIAEAFGAFETYLKKQQRTRLRLTPRNFTTVLQGMVQFFSEPLKAVRAFYNMIYAWDAGSRISLSERHEDQVTIAGGRSAGELIEHLRPEMRDDFKAYVERYAVHLEGEETPDAFFAKYDEALDAVDPEFRRVGGIFFTDMDLSRFAVWLVKQHLGDVGKNYLVIDPACGSGNLVTNWRAPMEFRHKVVSEIEPELLFAVERRMKGDAWHEGRFTVVPKVKDGKGLNFLDRPASSYLETLRKHLAEKGQNADRPIAFLCNPPFRNDKDRNTADPIEYTVHKSIVDMIGAEAAIERYCAFLAQMKLICDAAKESNLPGESLLLVFTTVSWLTDRKVLQSVKRALFADLEFVTGVLVNAPQFFDVDTKYPIAFTIWRHKPGAGTRNVTLRDLTHVKRSDLAAIPWTNAGETDAQCQKILASGNGVAFGMTPRTSIQQWSGAGMKFFLRNRGKTEPEGPNHTGGLPLGEPRATARPKKDKSTRTKAYGHADGQFVGFMGDMVPCRTRYGGEGNVWFRLDSPIQDARRARCMSGPPDQKGFLVDPTSTTAGDRLFTWYAIQKSMAQCGIPIWANPFTLWAPTIPVDKEAEIRRLTRAIAYADNDCVEMVFPANNPFHGAPELRTKNPMTPNRPDSYWSLRCVGLFTGREVPPTAADRLVAAADDLYAKWKSMFRMRPSVSLAISRPYYLQGPATLTATSGLAQIWDYIERKDDVVLRGAYEAMAVALKDAVREFHALLIGAEGLDYFGARPAVSIVPPAPSPPPVEQLVRTTHTDRAKPAKKE